MFSKRSIVLSDVEGKSNKKAVLCLQEDGGKVTGTVRLYNFAKEPAGILSLGFFVENKVSKAGLTLKSRMLYEFFLDFDKLPNKFSCAVVNFQNAQAAPILYGSSEGSDDNIYADIITEISNDASLKNTRNVLDKFGVDFDEEEKRQIEEEVEKQCDLCENCVYKKHFYETAKTEDFDEKQQKNAEILQKNAQKSDFSENYTVFENEITENKPQFENKLQKNQDLFYDRLKPQIDKLFEKNLPETQLQELIPYSKWVKVDFEDDGDFFVFGILYDEKNSPKCICYGVPAVFEEGPPQELDGYPIWLPLDDQHGFGYWMTYQDAATGEPIKAILD